MTHFSKPENSIKHSVRAKYVVTPDGSLRLAKIQRFSTPKFKEQGYESEPLSPSDVFYEDIGDMDISPQDKVASPDDVLRAVKRAQIRAFDYVLCNHDLDTFATFTYSPDKVLSKSSYNDCYNYLRPWLSNRVQRKGLKYVLVPEYTKVGDIHFHAIMNSSALNLIRARSAKTNRYLSHRGKPLYNIADWSAGFTSAELIGDNVADRDKVAKYIFKYMGKQMGARIGGRYCLTGGDLKKPVYLYGESPELFFSGCPCTYERHVDLQDVCGISYDEWSYI